MSLALLHHQNALDSLNNQANVTHWRVNPHAKAASGPAKIRRELDDPRSPKIRSRSLLSHNDGRITHGQTWKEIGGLKARGGRTVSSPFSADSSESSDQGWSGFVRIEAEHFLWWSDFDWLQGGGDTETGTTGGGWQDQV